MTIQKAVESLTIIANGGRLEDAYHGLTIHNAREFRTDLRILIDAQGMQLREDPRSGAEAKGLQPGPKDAPDAR